MNHLVTETGNYVFMAKVLPCQRSNDEPFGYGDRQLRLHGQSSPMPTKQWWTIWLRRQATTSSWPKFSHPNEALKNHLVTATGNYVFMAKVLPSQRSIDEPFGYGDRQLLLHGQSSPIPTKHWRTIWLRRQATTSSWPKFSHPNEAMMNHLVTETGNYVFMAKVLPSQRSNEEPFGYGDRQLCLHGQSSPIPTKHWWTIWFRRQATTSSWPKFSHANEAMMNHLVPETGNYFFMAKVLPCQRSNDEPFGSGDRQLRLHGQSSPIPTKQWWTTSAMVKSHCHCILEIKWTFPALTYYDRTSLPTRTTIWSEDTFKGDTSISCRCNYKCLCTMWTWIGFHNAMGTIVDRFVAITIERELSFFVP